jgi:hypothetical protein
MIILILVAVVCIAAVAVIWACTAPATSAATVTRSRAPG